MPQKVKTNVFWMIIIPLWKRNCNFAIQTCHIMQTPYPSTPTSDILVIRIGQDTLSVLSKKGSMPPATATWEMKSGISVSANLREALKTQPLLRSGEKATILVDAPTLVVPEDEFSADQSAACFTYTISGHDRDLKKHTVVKGLHAVVVFAIEKDLETVVSDHFTQYSFLPASVPMWEHLARQRSSHRRTLYGYFHDGKLDLVSFDKGRFLFCNTFSAAHVHDAVYYVLYAFSQMGMKAERDEVVIAGHTPHRKWIADNLQSYVQRVTVAEAKDLGLDGDSTLPLDMIITLNNNDR